ncbi:hypothetical protein PR048_031565 [Dryococelus australis]|uniref:Uncharacterized protein n=1 Tax=Dryococelus australis TaxID=614101 RepID=A0ABQ9G8G0_9NEOP|nr:hypothetical protein PR048_031565 [Dryococelus australis]
MAEVIVKNVLAPKSVKDLVDILSNEDDARKFFHLLQMHLITKTIEFFQLLRGTLIHIYKLLKQSVEQNGLDLRNVSSYCTDNAFVNYGKHHSVMILLKSDNEYMLKANCSTHVLHNYCKCACESLSIDIEVFILKLYDHFACSAK